MTVARRPPVHTARRLDPAAGEAFRVDETDDERLPGRETSLARLEAWLGDARDRGPRLALVRGAAEDAPERVVAAFAESTRRRGHPVFVGRAGPHGVLAPFLQIAAAADHWLRRQGLAPPPETRALREAGTDAAPRDGRARRVVILEALSALLAAATMERAGVIVIEDLAHAARGTAEVLGWLLGDVGMGLDLGAAPDAPRILVVASLPDDATPPLLDPVARAVRQTRVGPLGEEALARLLSSPDFVRRVAERTGGHVRLLDALVAPPSRADGGGPALLALAVLGRPADAEELAALVDDGADAGGIERALLDRPEVVREGDGCFRFLDPGQRAWTYRSAPEARRAEMHLRAAQRTPPLEGVRHARVARDAERFVALAPEAARRLAAEGAPAAAADLLESALPHVDEGRRGALELELAELLWAVGAWPRALPRAEAAALARPDDVRPLLLAARLLDGMGRRAEAEAALDQARALARTNGDAAALVEIDVRRADVRYRRAELDDAQALASGAAEVARSLGREDLALDARNVLGKVALHRGDLDEAVRSFEAQAEDAARVGSELHEAQALGNLGIALASRGDVDGARARLERAVELGGRCGAPFQRAMALRNLAWLDHVAGDLDSALHRYQRAVAAFKRLGDRETLVRLAGNLATLHLARGDLERAEELEHFARGLLVAESPVLVRAEVDQIAAHVALAGGRTDRARALLEGIAGLGARLTPWLAASASLGLAEVAVVEGRLDDVRAHLDALDGADYPLVAVRRALLEAELARAAGAPASPLARKALDLAEAAGHPARTLEARALLGAVLADEGRLDEAQRALDETLQATAVGRVPPPLREKLAALGRRIAEAGARATPAPTPGRAAPRRADPPPEDRLVGGSPPLRHVRELIRRIAPSGGAVLVTGESGTGKELVARALHDASERAGGPFVSVNCAAFVDTLLPSELFGHERGAFTGADRRRRGKFEAAHGGTLFLDEVGDVSPSMQAALLRVLQDGTFHRVGGVEPVHADVRIVSATNRDLGALVATGRFREDLLYRLRVVEVRMPPLRERLEDLPELVSHLLGRIAAERGAAPHTVSDAGHATLAAHPWPGNVRELDNALRAAVALAEGAVLGPQDFPLRAPALGDGAATGPSLASLCYARVRGGRASIYDLRRDLEREMIVRALAEADGNITRAAGLLGMKRPRLSQLVREYGLRGDGARGRDDQGDGR